MNEGQNFEQEDHLHEASYTKLKDGLHSLKSLCVSTSQQEDDEDAIFLEAMGDVLESLERTLSHHFESRGGHIISPKSSEPWD